MTQFNFIKDKKKRGRNRIKKIKAEQVGTYKAIIHGQEATIRQFQTVRQIDPNMGYYPNVGHFTDILMKQTIAYGEYDYADRT